MPWHKVQNSAECPTSQPWAVVKDSDGSIVGCHANEADADSQLAALYASEEADMAKRKETTFAAKLDDDKHAAIQQSVADTHDIPADDVDSEDDGAVLKVTATHGDGSQTTTTHALDDAGAITADSGDDDNDPDAEAKQIGAVKAVVATPAADDEDKNKSKTAPPFGKAAAASAARSRKVTWRGKTAAGEQISVVDDGTPPEQSNTAIGSFTLPIMVIEGAWTGDARFINPGCLTWRDLPLPLMALTETTMSHDGAKLVGKIDSIERRDMTEEDFNSRLDQPYEPGTTCLVANGTFDSAEQAQEIARLVNEGFLRGVSVDIGDVTSELVYLNAEGEEIDDPYGDDDFWDILFGFTAGAAEDEAEHEDGEDGGPLTIGERIVAGRIMGATVCPFPAFEGAYIEVNTGLSASIMPVRDDFIKERMPSMRLRDKVGERKLPRGLTAASAPMAPPADWFEDPKLDGPTALTITKSGEIFGHLATWSECHMSYTNQCIKAPHSMTNYSYFTTGCVLCSNDEVVPTGVITMNTGHAELWQDSDTAKAHYDHTGTAVADIVAGDDAYGIWVHGALRPDTDELSVRRLRGAALSGDWRQIGGSLELVAALAVNVPGFPVKRPSARIAGGGPSALVAAGRITQADAQRLAQRPARKLAVAEDPDAKIVKQFIRDNLRAKVHQT